MKLTKSQFLAKAHSITRMKNIAYFGSYQKAFSHVLKTLYAQGGLFYGFQIIEPKQVWA